MRLLLVEDDTMLGSELKAALECAGYTIDWALCGEEASAAARSSDYGAILLDLQLPGINGMVALRQIRDSKNSVPILILTASDRAEQKIGGLNEGADDYLVKPFDLGELLARVRAVIRRREGRLGEIVMAGSVQLDLVGRTVTRNSQPISITAKEFKVLSLLMRNAGRFVNKTELENALYDDAADVESNTVEVTIYALRRKLGKEFIATTRGLGYLTPR